MTTKKISVFLLARSLEVGGAERQLVALAKGLRDRGHSVTIGLFYRRGELVREVEESEIIIVDLGKKGRWDLASFLTRAIAAVRRSKADVVYSFLGGANLISAAIRPFVPKPRYVWSVRASKMHLEQYDWVRRVGYSIECTLSGKPDLIIANSRAGAEYSISNGFPRDKVIVIPNGIDTSRFRRVPELRVRERRELGLRDGEIAVGMMARLDLMKGYPVFLQAAAIAAERMGQLRFLCIGEGPELTELQRLRDELGLGERVTFTGSREPVAALNALDVACSCSWGEGFSNSIAEAMSCGLPVIVTDVGDSALIVEDAGIVVPPGSPQRLADAIVEQSSALGEHDPQRVRDRIVENFAPAAMVDATLDAFHKLLGLDKAAASSEGKPS